MFKIRENRVEQARWGLFVFVPSALIGLASLLYVGFILKEWASALVLFGLFGGLGILPLFSYITCYYEFDELGFIRSNFFGIKKYYYYSEITAFSLIGANIYLELNGTKKIVINDTWSNKEPFLERIMNAIPDNTPEVKVLFGSDPLTNRAILEATDVKKAVMVDTKDQAAFKKVKTIYRCILWPLYGLGVVLLLSLTNDIFEEVFEQIMIVGIVYTLVINIVAVISLIMYYTKPQYFTMRENNTKSEIEYYKIALVPFSFMMASFTNYIVGLFAGFVNGYLAAIISIALMVLYLIIFRKYSWEYKNYKVGYYSAIFFGLFYIGSICILLWNIAW